jgi:hypothetical protein
MSYSPFPDPRTTNFIPKAWDFRLFNKYVNYLVSYTGAQNATINFIGPVYLTTRTLLTQWADTAYATSEIVAWTAANVPALLPVAQTWANLQYYFGGIAVNTINPLTTGGTLLIGNSSIYNSVYVDSEDGRSTTLRLGTGNTSTGGIHINNGTGTTGDVSILNGTGSTGTLTLGSSTATITLNAPLTPLYSYPIASGKIGAILNSVLLIGTTGTGNSSISLRRIDFPVSGVWALFASINGGGTAPPYPNGGSIYGFSFSTLTGGTGTLVIQKFGQPAYSTDTPFLNNLFATGYFATGTSLFFNSRTNTAIPVTSEFFAYRLS